MRLVKIQGGWSKLLFLPELIIKSADFSNVFIFRDLGHKNECEKYDFACSFTFIVK
ncbi:MAG: hypothetical protein HRK26_00920 [Rickettsiaceae bacterium H1]|nr:hypothetical protein [Rickettsiaceae bacterium H1]